MILAIDIGNTRTKAGLFEHEEMQRFWNIPSKDLENGMGEILADIPAEINLQIGWASVAKRMKFSQSSIWSKFANSPKFTHIHSQMALPIKSKYATPDTLGTDRIVAIIGAQSMCEGVPILVIDAGTAITYDFANAEGEYIGGGIAPGMVMRFRALHEFTARLPLISPDEHVSLIGDSTETCIQSGVQWGTIAEIERIIDYYKSEVSSDLQVFLTGGDTSYFENHLKNINFADSNLILKGIHYILTR